jgi:endonuclease YncB( thermonuclease family)
VREPWLLGFVFVAGLALGSLLPWHASSPPFWPNVGGRQSLPPSVSEMVEETPRPGTRRGPDTILRQPAEVLRVIDGDTFEARVRLWPGLEMTTRVRLRGIDAPELKSACADEFSRARMAREALEALLAEGPVAIFNIGPDKYHGRVVADAQTPRTPDVSAALLAAGHARPYQGGRRGGWCAIASR